MKNEKFNLSKIFVYIILFALVAGILYIAYGVYNQNIKNISQKIKQDSSVNYVIDYLQTNFDGNYPLPSGDLVLLDKNFNQIHLEDRGVALDTIKDLYVVQGNLCSLGITDANFLSKIYDQSLSVGENKKCYSYAVTADRKYFQIGKIDTVNFEKVANLNGNIDHSITRDFQSMNLVQNGSKVFFPYSPYSNDKFSLKLLDGDFKELSILENDMEIKYDYTNIKNGISFPQQDGITNIKIQGKGTNYVLQIVDPKGNLITVSPDDNGESSTEMNNYLYSNEKTDVSFVNMLGKYVFNLTKLSDNSSFTVSERNGGVLVIRGTKFVLDAGKNYSMTFLGQGNIHYKHKSNIYQLDNRKTTIGFDENANVINLFSKSSSLSRLYGFAVAMDSLIRLKSVLSVAPQSSAEDKNEIIKNKFQMENIGSYLGKFSNTTYSLHYFSGSFPSNVAVDLVSNREYAIDILNSYCENGMVNLSDAYIFLNYIGLSKNDQGLDKLQFQYNQGLNNVINGRTILVFDNQDELAKAENSSITFFDNQSGDINFKNISSNNSSDKIDGMLLICK